jgi:hypothetical protein
MMGCMDDSVSPEEEAFIKQSLESRSPDRRRIPGKYSPVINVPSSQLPMVSLPVCMDAVYEHWCETGKIAMLQAMPGKRRLDYDALLAAYRFGLEKSRARCADFRDAVIDALSEL